MQDIHLSPAEAAAKLGVSAKALRVYEGHGLVKPLRSVSGWRVYGPAEMVRLHQILSLKALGLTLSKIMELVAGRLGSLDAILALQEQILVREAGRLGRALRLIRAARKRMATGKALTIEELANLTTETRMPGKITPEELESIFKPLVEKHFSQSDMAEIGSRKHEAVGAEAKWAALMIEAERLMKIGDTASPEARDLAARWEAMVDAFTGGNPVLASKVKSVWNEAMADPSAAPKLPASPEMFAFIHRAIQHRREFSNSR